MSPYQSDAYSNHSPDDRKVFLDTPGRMNHPGEGSATSSN